MTAVIQAAATDMALTSNLSGLIGLENPKVFSPQDASLALKHVGAAVKPGGRIYIIGQILNDSRRSPLGAVGTNLNFINHYDAGESYTEKEHRGWLTDAGFVDIERANFLLDDGSGLMTARTRI